MKIKFLKSFAVGLVVAIVALTQYGCEQEWQKEFESSKLKAPASVELAVSSIKDSTAVLTYTQSLVGQLYVVVVPGDEETPAPAENSLLKLTEANAVFTRQIFVTNEVADGLKPMNNKVLTDTLNIKGLVQNVSYKVFALPVNTDGVFGAVGTTAAFVTADDANPLVLKDKVSPKLLDEADSVNFVVTIPFDEPVVITEANKAEIFFTYLNLVDLTTFNKPAKAKVEGNNLIVEQTYEPLPGQPVFLSIGDNVVSDRANNFYEGQATSLATFPDGFIWYAAPVIDTIVSIAPDTASVVIDVNFTIDITYGLEMDFYRKKDSSVVFDSKDVIVRYTNNGTTIEMEVPVSKIDIDGKVVSITPPRTPIYGETVTLKIAEGAYRTIYSSDCEAVEFNDYEWFVSYGYTRDLVLGDYIIGNLVSHFYGPIADEYAVTLSAHASDANRVVISGLLGSEDDFVAEFNGDFASFTIPAPGGLGQKLTFPEGHPFADYIIEIWNGYAVDGVAVGFINSNGTIDMAGFGFYLYDAATGDGLFWYDLFPSSTWTKQAGGKSSVATNYVLKTQNFKAKRVF